MDVSYSDRQGKTINSVESDETIFNTLLPNEESPLGSYPESTQLLTNYIGTSAQLKCDAMNHVAFGAPDILYWTKDGKVIRLDSRFRQMGNGTLMVYNTTQSDSGIYECVAKRGRERRTTSTQVLIVPLSNESTTTTTKGLQPKLLSNLSQYSYDIGLSTDRKDLMMAALEEASTNVDKAINATLTKMGAANASKSDSIKALRYPLNENDRFFIYLLPPMKFNTGMKYFEL